jgi:hypothetical protein
MPMAARVELARLRALSATLASIPFNEPGEPLIMARHPKHEVLHGWVMDARQHRYRISIRHSATCRRRTRVAAVTNGLPGECEGFLPCYPARASRSEASTSAGHPAGRHAAGAVDISSAPRRRSRPR